MVTVSDYTRDTVKRLFQDIEPRRIYNGIYTTFYSPSDGKSERPSETTAIEKAQTYCPGSCRYYRTLSAFGVLTECETDATYQSMNGFSIWDDYPTRSFVENIVILMRYCAQLDMRGLDTH